MPALPPWLPAAVLATGVVTALTGALLGEAWVAGFAALFLLITALDAQNLQNSAWPAGTGLVAGLLHLMSGRLQRDVLQYALGTWLALLATAAVLLGAGGQATATAVLGGGGYLLAAAPERWSAAASPRWAQQGAGAGGHLPGGARTPPRLGGCCVTR
ncbi:hypothetical protein GTQ99_17440 [Kineococcus sp. T13]|uniref:hypothetical protein n=1 Tax=Kineococcus vitellinus TaxID=2696565 RepID=UPI001411B385|nr:hypothetical protein [Kineococcus vitellinus]NAZ77192.1 hypothetical protein [Kineococcus vitellinus]